LVHNRSFFILFRPGGIAGDGVFFKLKVAGKINGIQAAAKIS
jgi:hypothetical protein